MSRTVVDAHSLVCFQNEEHNPQIITQTVTQTVTHSNLICDPESKNKYGKNAILSNRDAARFKTRLSQCVLLESLKQVGDMPA